MNESNKTVNPWLNVKRKYNDIAVERRVNEGFLKLIVLFSLTIALCGVGGATYIGSLSKFVPLVFQVDSFNNTLGVLRGDAVPAATDADFKDSAEDFITNVRTVTSDQIQQAKMVRKAFSYLTKSTGGWTKTNEYYTATPESHPLKRAEEETVSVDNVVALKESGESWQVDWVETVRNINGEIKKPPFKMKAILQLNKAEPTTDTSAEDLLNNKHFIFVKDFNWTTVN